MEILLWPSSYEHLCIPTQPQKYLRIEIEFTKFMFAAVELESKPRNSSQVTNNMTFHRV